MNGHLWSYRAFTNSEIFSDKKQRTWINFVQSWKMTLKTIISLKQNREHCVLVMLSFSTSSLSDYCSPSSNIYLKWLRSHLKRYSEGYPSFTDSLRATELLNLGWKTDAAGRKVGIDFKIQSCGYHQVLAFYGVYLSMGYTFVLIHRGTVEAVFPR